MKLDWHGKNEAILTTRKTPYRLLREKTEFSYCLQGFTPPPQNNINQSLNENLIIQGDNLDALKSLLPFYAGQVKCIFIDPPYNTGSAFSHYDDNLEHSLWLNMMYPRLELLRELLAEDGSIWITLDDNEVHYFKVMCDEIFGRKNFINQVSLRMKETAGASGGGEDKKLKKNIEYLLIYVKNFNSFNKFNDIREEEDLFDYIEEMRNSGKSWKYTRIMEYLSEPQYIQTITDGKGDEIQIFNHKNVVMTPINDVMKRENLTEKEVYLKYFNKIFRDTNAQSSIRTRVIENTSNRNTESFFSIKYIPISGKNKGQETTIYYKGNNCDQIAWLSDIAYKKHNKIIRLSKIGTYWQGFPLNNLTKEGGIQFPNGKKPEELIKRIIELSTNAGDLVLDSFLGSGTTAAVAHKMNRRYIGIEIGEHAKTHVVPRLQKVIDGSDTGGISGSLNWQGGGSYRFCELGEVVFDEYGALNPSIRFAELAAHIWYLENHVPMPAQTELSPLLGVYHGRAYYLLYNGILGDKKPQGGNVLTRKVLAELPRLAEFQQAGLEIVIYGEATRLKDYLAEQHIVFKQIPYDVTAK